MKPILRWAGSKRKLLPKILPCIANRFERYIEPFVGSGCVYLALNPEKAILGDLNASLIDTYKTICRKPREVSRAVHSMPVKNDFYYSLRSQAPEDLGAVERAARFVYLNRYCFNGVYRTNKSGQFNVPRGTNSGSIPNEDEFVAFAKAFSKAKLMASDFEQCLDEAKDGDFVYLDPPYSHPDIRYRGEYGYGAFAETDVVRLLHALELADSRGAAILMSYNCTLQNKLPGWNRRRLAFPRFPGRFA